MRRLRLRDAHLRHTAPRFQILETWRWADERKRATDFLSFLSFFPSFFFFSSPRKGKTFAFTRVSRFFFDEQFPRKKGCTRLYRYRVPCRIPPRIPFVVNNLEPRIYLWQVKSILPYVAAHNDLRQSSRLRLARSRMLIK